MKIGVDLDGTLAEQYWEGWPGMYEHDMIGEPIKQMVFRVQHWISAGHEVVLFTARAWSGHTEEDLEAFKTAWRVWSLQHIGKVLPVTSEKSPDFDEFWDDKAVRVEHNHGEISDGDDVDDPVEYLEET